MKVAVISILGKPVTKIKFINKKVRIGKKWKYKLCGCVEHSEDFKRFLNERKNILK